MKKTLLILLVFLFTFELNVNAQSIVTSKHNLSVSGTGDIKAASETELCLFCHTTHNSNPVAPLWNKKDQGFERDICGRIRAEQERSQISSIRC